MLVETPISRGSQPVEPLMVRQEDLRPLHETMGAEWRLVMNPRMSRSVGERSTGPGVGAGRFSVEE
jgi:hypothetical protein